MIREQTRYNNNNGSKDLIDHWAEVKSPIEFRAIMIANIEKYCRRYGKKDDVLVEAKKIQDYATRLVEYETTSKKKLEILDTEINQLNGVKV